MYFVFAETKSDQIYLLATTPFLLQAENRGVKEYNVLNKFSFFYIFYLFLTEIVSEIFTVGTVNVW